MTEAQLRQVAAGLAASGQSMLARLLAELLDLRAAVGAVMEMDTSSFGLQARVIAAQQAIRAAMVPPEGGR